MRDAEAEPAGRRNKMGMWAGVALLTAVVAATYWSALAGLAGRWFSDADYVHCPFVPLFAAVLLWHRREMLGATQRITGGSREGELAGDSGMGRPLWPLAAGYRGGDADGFVLLLLCSARSRVVDSVPGRSDALCGGLECFAGPGPPSCS